MPIRIDHLTHVEDLVACEDLQRSLLGERARAILAVPTLAAIRRSGGLLLGAWEEEGGRRTLRGALVDMVAEADGYPARFSALVAVDPAYVNRGIAQSLRAMERDDCTKRKVDLVYGWADPLCGSASHIAFNRLGAIATAHTRNALGPLDDRLHCGLATDRVRIEWWIASPRVIGILDHGKSPPHFELGLERMQVLTRTTAQRSGHRRPIGLDASPEKSFVLVEIPADLDRLRENDLRLAKEWRLVTREALELLFSNGYTIVGFIHEGGRSFHLFERSDRGTILGRVPAS